MGTIEKLTRFLWGSGVVGLGREHVVGAFIGTFVG